MFPDHFSGVAADYARYRPHYPTELVELLADAAPGHELAWDAGCGSGQLAVALTARFTHVIATDASARQLEHATRHAQVEYRCATAERSGLADASVSLAVAAQAAHWFDLDGYYAEVRRVARPGAAVALVTYALLRVDPEVDAAFDRVDREVLAGHWPPERRHVDEGYRSLPFPFVELPVPELSMENRWTLHDVLAFMRTWSAVRDLDQAGAERLLEHAHELIAPAWGNPDEARRVRWPLTVRLGRV